MFLQYALNSVHISTPLCSLFTCSVSTGQHLMQVVHVGCSGYVQSF